MKNKNLIEQLDELYGRIYAVCDDEGSDDVLCLLDDVCAREGLEDVSSRYFNEDPLTNEEALALIEAFEIVLSEIE